MTITNYHAKYVPNLQPVWLGSNLDYNPTIEYR